MCECKELSHWQCELAKMFCLDTPAAKGSSFTSLTTQLACQIELDDCKFQELGADLTG